VNQWQPIETAPPDTEVELGWWFVSGGYSDSPGKIWVTAIGKAWRAEPHLLFWTRYVRTWRDEATHWRPLPPPPVTP